VAAIVSVKDAAPVGVRVDADAVRILRHEGAPIVLPFATLEAVEVPPHWGDVTRLNGHADSRVWYGRFRSSTVGDFDLHAWQRKTWVLLRTDRGSVVVTPDDAARFVEEVGAGLARRR
jgi:hypothetical protein